MPLSRCRFCGKMVPNIFHKWHEKFQCVEARKLRGEYVSPEARKLAEKRRREDFERLKNQPQKLIEDFINVEA